ncbi:MAG: hypothetical protein QOE70_4606 [Chthoniobacter sp.]|jgi:hypothetical protein|nr:hypothetical protein [Chthoniobacter sp.]
MDCNRPTSKNPDEWLQVAPDFSRPIVSDLREWIFRIAPDLTESIKWNMLCFSGRKLVCGLSACQKHIGIAFFRGTELPDPAGLFHAGEGNTNIRSVRLTSARALNRKAFATLLLAAVELDAQPDIPPAPKVKREPWPMPDFFAAALKANQKAAAGFASFAPTYQREYLVWLTTARRPETRAQRLAQTLAALAAGRKWAERRLV